MLKISCSIRLLFSPLTLFLFFVLSLPLNAHATNTILVLGDSLSAGYGIAAQDSWPSLMQTELKRSHPAYKIINASISGETAMGGRQRIHSVLQQHQPDILILELGGNDGLRGNNPNEIANNLAVIIDAAQRNRSRILLLGIKLPPNYGEPYITQFHRIYIALAKKYRIPLLPFLLDGVTPEQFQADNLHPDAAAQPTIMRNVLHALRPLLH